MKNKKNYKLRIELTKNKMKKILFSLLCIAITPHIKATAARKKKSTVRHKVVVFSREHSVQSHNSQPAEQDLSDGGARQTMPVAQTEAKRINDEHEEYKKLRSQREEDEKIARETEKKRLKPPAQEVKKFILDTQDLLGSVQYFTKDEALVLQKKLYETKEIIDEDKTFCFFQEWQIQLNLLCGRMRVFLESFDEENEQIRAPRKSKKSQTAPQKKKKGVHPDGLKKGD